NDLTPAERQAAKQKAQEAADAAKGEIDKATNTAAIESAKEAGVSKVSVILPAYKIRVSDTANIDQTTKDKLKEELLRLNPGVTIIFGDNRVTVNNLEIPYTELIAKGNYEVNVDTPNYDRPRFELGVILPDNNKVGKDKLNFNKSISNIDVDSNKEGTTSSNKDEYQNKKLPKTGAIEQNTIFYGATVLGLGLMIASLRRRIEEEKE
ncbi:LPXTG cell wall anchor domain-containing protein, partial [Granulicatella sp. zg-84]|uniref:LPXTG cell wall anchor domain-containing protein n=1 Tax=Granulicatella sp. zg-84 TaxID=2678503 RepID=UPI0013BF4C5B